MLKTIKVSENMYNDVKKLRDELQKSGSIAGVYEVKLSMALGYAVKNALESLRRRERMLSSAGGWSDIDANALIKDIYDNRRKGTRWSAGLD